MPAATTAMPCIAERAVSTLGRFEMLKRAISDLRPKPLPSGARQAPMPPAPGPLGHLSRLREDPAGALLQWRHGSGDIVRLRFSLLTAHLVARPEHIRHVLVDAQRNYDKQTPGFRQLRYVLGNGLLTSEGEFWLRQRRIAQPAFHRDHISGFASKMVRAACDMAEEWEMAAADDRPIDLGAEMMRLTLRIVGETLLSTDVSRDADAIGRSLGLLLKGFSKRVRSAVPVPPVIPTPENRRLRAAVDTLDQVVRHAVEARRASRDRPDDMLTMLMEAEDEHTGATMSDQQLRDEVMTIFLAGHETTANALTWAFYALSLYPDVRRRMNSELDHTLLVSAPTLTDLPELPYTRAVVSETLRRYPPAWSMGRRVVADDEIGGYFIPAGSLVLISPYVVHHHPEFWQNPIGFDPERFLGDPVLPRFTYFPFGAGPRICIGQSFALMEAQLLLATLAQRFELDLVAGYDVRPEASVTLRPSGPVMMRIRKRSKAAAHQG